MLLPSRSDVRLFVLLCLFLQMVSNPLEVRTEFQVDDASV